MKLYDRLSSVTWLTWMSFSTLSLVDLMRTEHCPGTSDGFANFCVTGTLFVLRWTEAIGEFLVGTTYVSGRCVELRSGWYNRWCFRSLTVFLLSLPFVSPEFPFSKWRVLCAFEAPHVCRGLKYQSIFGCHPIWYVFVSLYRPSFVHSCL